MPQLAIVVSNYNSNPEWLLKYSSNLIIYDQSDTQEGVDLLRDFTVTETLANSGHNINSNMRYIHKNYSQLPDLLAFVKTTTVPRHCTINFFEHSIVSGYYSGLWEPSSSHYSQLSLSGHLIEYNDSWYMRTKIHKYFCNTPQFLKFVFQNPKIPEYLTFVPGANLIVEQKRLARFPKAMFEFLEYLTSYTFFPAEAYLVERLLTHILFSSEKLNSYMYDFEETLEKLSSIELGAGCCHVSLAERIQRKGAYMMTSSGEKLKNRLNGL